MFVFEVLEEVPEGQNPLQVEDMWLVQHVGKAECYNINPSAESPRSGMLMTAESKAKLSKSRKGKAAGADHYRYGQTVSPKCVKRLALPSAANPKKKVARYRKRVGPRSGPTLKQDVATSIGLGEPIPRRPKLRCRAQSLQPLQQVLSCTWPVLRICALLPD